MSGNVYEWNWDWYASLTSDPKMDPRGATSGSFREMRDGSWNSDAGSCQVGDRYFDGPYNEYYNHGFRVVSR